ncbi:MAG: hypothetical protein ACRD2Q_07695 [Terriglobales bacterium]
MLIRETTLDDAPEIMCHRRFMFRDMGYRDEAALDAMQATSEPYIRAGLKDGNYHGWLAIGDEGRGLYQSMGFAATNEMKLTFDLQPLPEKG